LRIVPLGGLGEIGRNCLALEQPDGILIIDVGTSFPHDDVGIDVHHPDFSWLVERVERIAGVFLTHGHEDHIGGLPYLLDRLDVPVFGPPHALGMARRRLAEHAFAAGDLDFREVRAGSLTRVGPFEVEPIRVSHSITEASALCIRTAEGWVVHSGDFNFDPDPPDGEPSDVARLEAVGDRGVELLLSDSTNIDTAERQGSEKGVAAALERIIAGADQRVVVALFASNIQRLISLGDVAARHDTRVCLLGRSLTGQREVATAIRRLRWPSGLLVDPERAREVPRDRLLVLAGGTQAEPMSALSRLAAGTHPHLELAEGDRVVFSSRIIPGNERAVLGLRNDLLRRGLILHTSSTDPDVHTSGHGGRSEQRRMLELVRPRAFVPVHGTLSHLRRHAELAREVGVGDVMVVENGSVLRYSAGAGLARDGTVVHGKVAVAHGGEVLSEETWKRRVELGRVGVVCVSVVVDAALEAVEAPRIVSRGVPVVDGSDPELRAIARDVVAALTRARGRRGVDVEDEIRRAVRRRVQSASGTRPVIEVLLHRPGD
jgi:ribonuclease J